MIDNKTCKHICLFGGPNTGKSVTAAGLFNKMKRLHMNVENVHEVAKDLVYSKDFFTLKDQLLILARQHHNWFKLQDQVDYTINDSPFLLSLAYIHPTDHIDDKIFKDLILSMYKSYDTLNIFLERDHDLPYQEVGRMQDKDGAVALDVNIKQLLIDNDIPFTCVKIGKKTIKSIMKLIKA